MKATIYLRVGKTRKGAIMSASSKPSSKPLEAVQARRGHAKGFVPTVAFAVQVDIPDSLFNQASNVIATLTVSEKNARIAAQIESPSK